MAGEDPEYMRWLRQQRCCMYDGQCAGTGVQGHHLSFGGGRGKSQKNDDSEAFPFCMRHHGQFHALRGEFKGWERPRLLTFQREMIAKYRTLYFTQSPIGSPSVNRAALDAFAWGAVGLEPPTPELARRMIRTSVNDPKAIAERFALEHGLSNQIRFDLERELRAFEKALTGSG